MSEEIYQDVQEKLDNTSLFQDILVKIRVRECTPLELDRSNWSPYSSEEPSEDDDTTKSDYIVLGLDFQGKEEDFTGDSKSEDIFNHVKRTVDRINRSIKRDYSKRGRTIYLWNIFYVYKELFQGLVDETGNPLKSNKKGQPFNYFRGQILNYPMKPGIFRSGIKNEFVTNFDKIYRELCNEYPKQLKYIPYSAENRRERVQQLSLLQHYGLKTSLVDITRNPFIALEFMTDLRFSVDWQRQAEKQNLNCGSFEMFAIDEEEHSESNIFVDVAKTDLNRRLIAQSGAFFCFDYLKDLAPKSIRKIPRIRISWEFDKDDANRVVEILTNQIEEYKNVPIEKYKIDAFPSEEVSDDMLKSIIQQTYNTQQNLLADYKKGIDEQPLLINNQMYRDIQDKLSEFFYFKKNLFPDLDKYIEFITSKYTNDPELSFAKNSLI